MSFSPLLVQLIDALRCMPGVGKKSAQRIAFHLLERDRDGASNLSAALRRPSKGIGHCSRCRMLTEHRAVLNMLGQAGATNINCASSRRRPTSWRSRTRPVIGDSISY